MAERIRLYPGVSFMTHGPGYSDANLFDVPEEEYFEGSLTGIKAAWELLHAASMGSFDEGGAAAVLRNAMEEATHVLGRTGKSQEPSRRGAAVGFLEAMAGALAHAVKAWDFRPTLTRDIRGYTLVGERVRRAVVNFKARATAPRTRPLCRPIASRMHSHRGPAAPCR